MSGVDRSASIVIATRVATRFFLVILLVLHSAHLVAAHHGMDGATPLTWLEGFMSGLAHPVIGPDHLAFIFGIGILSRLIHQEGPLPIAFIVATFAGTGIHLAGVAVQHNEVIIAFGVLALAVVLAANSRYLARHPFVPVIFVAAGMFHGYAYGESIVGAEPAPLISYLVGFASVQLAIAMGAAHAMRLAERALPMQSTGFARLASAAVIGLVGVAMFARQIG